MAERAWASPDQAAVRILDGSSQIGTGCLIGGGLILTSEALVSGGGLAIISASSPSPMPAHLAWTGNDVAVLRLRIDDSLLRDLPGARPGRLPRSTVPPPYRGDITWFPDGPSNRGLERVDGFIELAGEETRRFEFAVASLDRTVTGETMAGAPVWISDWLIGIVTSSTATPVRRRGVLVNDLLSDPAFPSLTKLTSEPVPVVALVAAPAQTDDLELSGSCREVIVRAAKRAGDQPVDASFIVVSALQYADELQLGGITSALLDKLSARRDDGIAPHQLLAELDAALPGHTGPSVLAPPPITALIAARPLARLLTRAADAVQFIAGHREVHLRHLVAATVLADDPPLRPELLRALGVTRAELLSLLREAARAETTGESQDAWQALLRPAPVQLAGGISTDRVDPTRGIPLDEDDLAFGVWAAMFAAIIAADDTPMPLSVGVFGAWGAGKSYFMGLLREAIDRQAGTGAPYLHNIVQIGFNAWHYTDTNLWASLGDEIFRQLAGPSPTASQSREKLRRDLAEAQVQRKELEARTEQAKNETTRLEAELRQATAQRQAGVRDLLTAVVQSAELRRQLDPVWRRLGIRDEAEQTDMLAGQIRGISQDARAIEGLLRQRPTWIMAVICLIALLATVAGVFIPTSWGIWLRNDGAAGTAVLVLGFGLTLATRVGSGLTRLRAVAADLSQRTAEAAARDPESPIGAALDKLNQAEASEKMVREQLQQAVGRAGELATELAGLMPGQRLYTFLAERAASGAYASALGLVSTIRKDFEQLVELLKDRRGQDGQGEPRPIDRIVLYIDDLDRCRPEQVVEVLQAVHLLLALDLFVVVVGVDPRWLMRSLRQQYHGILNDAPVEQRALAEVTPVDYLEKIFNIPFVLPGLRPDSLEHLIRRLSAVRGGDDAAAVEEPPQTRDLPGLAPEPVPVPEPAEAIGVQLGSQLAAAFAGVAAEPPRPLTDPEVRLIAALEPFIATPRDAKRMFNVYRMLRSTRDLSDASDFLGDDDRPGEFQAVAVLLAMMTADAHLLHQVLDAPPDLAMAIPGGLTSWPAEGSWREFAAALVPGPAGNKIIGPVPAQEVGAWRRLADAAVRTVDLVSLPDLTAFLTWAPRIRRFSYLLSPLDGARQAAGPRGDPAARPPDR